jgi:hypothetical protein
MTTIRLRTMELPGGNWVFVVDNVTISEQEEFARAFNVFAEGVRDRTDGRCVGGLVFHDPVELPGDPLPLPFDMQPVPMEENVSVCQSCRSAADGTDLRIAKCSHCDRAPMAVYNDAVPEGEQKVYRHNHDGTMCPGSFLPPAFTSGHDYCNGCPCQHRPKGSWNGG